MENCNAEWKELVEEKGENGVTYLHLTASADKVEWMEDLLTHGADVNVKDDEGLTPLHYAVRSQHIEAVKVLLENGADVNVKDDEGLTPLHYCAQYTDDVNMAQLLIGHGADIQAKSNDGLVPLVAAAIGGHFSLVPFLVLLIKQTEKKADEDTV